MAFAGEYAIRHQPVPLLLRRLRQPEDEGVFLPQRVQLALDLMPPKRVHRAGLGRLVNLVQDYPHAMKQLEGARVLQVVDQLVVGVFGVLVV